MKKHSWIAVAVFITASATASAQAPLHVTADDLTAAGVSGVIEVVPEKDRFQAPVRYFRITEKLSLADAKKDCADCADLVAIYAAEVSSVPRWVTEPQQQFVKIGGRLQVRAYIASEKRIVTVTGPSETTVRKISKHLVAKFSR